MESQKSAFLNYEANSWFDINKGALVNYKTENDEIISLLKFYKKKPNNILEIECSAGYRLTVFEKVIQMHHFKISFLSHFSKKI